MSASVNAKLCFKGILYALLGIVVAALGIVAVGFFGDYFELHPLYATISLSNSLGIDVYGAVIPIIIALVSVVLFVRSTRAPIKKLAIALVASLFLAFFLCRQTDEGLAGLPLLLALVVSAVAAALNVFPKPFVNLRKNFIASLSLTLSCVPLSLFFTDLIYSPYFDSSVIGGGGLSDGLLLSTLYVPSSVTIVFSVLAYVSQMVWLVRKNQVTSKMGSPTNPIISETR
jgi:hypothetical protein